MQASDPKYAKVASVDVELDQVYGTRTATLTTGGYPPHRPASSERLVGPKPLKKSRAASIPELLLDLALIALSTLFLAFALAVIHFNGKPTQEHTHAKTRLITASTVGPTVFPLLFACIIGRTAHAILLWRLENGECMGVLDVLAGSTSLTSTITSQVRMRFVSLVGVTLVLLWALSPIGGQASINQLGFGNGTRESAVDFYYMTQTSNTDAWSTTDDSIGYALPINAVFLSAITAPVSTRNSTLDVWGNVKIPFVEAYENASKVADADGWFNTNDSDPVYASVIGIPMNITGKSASSDYTLKIQTSYFHLEDDSAEVLKHISIVNDSYFESSSGFSEGSLYLAYNGTDPGKSESGSWGPCGMAPFGTETTLLRMNNVCIPPANITINTPRTFGYYAPLGGMLGLSITTTYVEAEVVCRSNHPCAVTRVRRSQLEHPPPGYTVLNGRRGSGAQDRNDNWGLFAANFVTASDFTDLGVNYEHTLMSGYIWDSDRPYDLLLKGYDTTTSQTITRSNDQAAIRLAQLMNGYWTSFTGFTAITGGLNNNTSNMTSIPADKLGMNEFYANATSGVGMKTDHFEVFQCSLAWAIVLIVISSILIVACLVHPVIQWRLVSPDLALNFSSLATRNNPYVGAANSISSSLSASERARILKKERVCFGDVEAEGNVGLLAIASMDGLKGLRVDKPRKGRLYR